MDRVPAPSCIRAAPGRVDRVARNRARGALQRDLVLSLLRAFLDRLRVVRDGGIPVSDARRLLALTVGVPCRAPRHEQGENDSNHKPVLQHRHSIFTPVQSGLLPHAFLAGQPNRRPSAPVNVLHNHRFVPNPHETVLTRDDVAFMAAHGTAAIAEGRQLDSTFFLQQPDVFQRNRGRRRRPQRCRIDRWWRRRFWRGVPRRRRRRRRRFHVEPERIPFARLCLGPGLLQCPDANVQVARLHILGGLFGPG